MVVFIVDDGFVRDIGILHRIGQSKADAAGLSSRIKWLGAQPHTRVLKELDEGDLFVLPANVARDNDRDGIPNAILEAQGRGVPVLSASAGGIGEAVKDKVSGRLVPPSEPQALATLLAELIADPSQRAKLGLAGFNSVREHFDAEAGYDRIAELLRPHLG